MEVTFLRLHTLSLADISRHEANSLSRELSEKARISSSHQLKLPKTNISQCHKQQTKILKQFQNSLKDTSERIGSRRCANYFCFYFDMTTKGNSVVKFEMSSSSAIMPRILIVLGMVAAVVTILYFTPMPGETFKSK